MGPKSAGLSVLVKHLGEIGDYCLYASFTTHTDKPKWFFDAMAYQADKIVLSQFLIEFSFLQLSYKETYFTSVIHNSQCNSSIWEILGIEGDAKLLLSIPSHWSFFRGQHYFWVRIMGLTRHWQWRTMGFPRADSRILALANRLCRIVRHNLSVH
jgi:hypothetical protein